METVELFDFLFNQALAIGMATLRVAMAFSLLPIFSNELIPAFVRNAIFVALAIVVIVTQPEVPVDAFTLQDWFSFIAKEAFMGIAIGIFFGVFLWAFEVAGQIIDIQVGTSSAQIFDPIGGHQTSLFGEFFGRLGNYIFMAAGGLMMLAGGTMESYMIWPLNEPLPDLQRVGVILFEEKFSSFFSLALLIAAPVLILTFLIDVTMGLINRYAQQFNVFFLSMSIKMFTSIFMISLSLVFIVRLLIEELSNSSDELIQLLHRLIA